MDQQDEMSDSASGREIAVLASQQSEPTPGAIDDRRALRSGWSWPARLGFRFAFVWFLLFIIPFPLSALPWQRLGEASVWLDKQDSSAAKAVAKAINSSGDAFGNYVAQPWREWKNRRVLWIADHWFNKQLEQQPPPTGSGDTTRDWIELLGVTVAAAGAALLWSLLAFRWRDHSRLHDAWRTVLRFDLATWLVLYGSIKIIPSQMPAPDLDRLCQPVGDMSPMGMLWTFLGSSTAYECFSGAAEMTAGWLLVWRGTSTIGAFVAFAVMGNVFVMNCCYDVPVKIFSGRLALQAVALFVPALPRLFQAFVLHRAVPAAPIGALFPWRWANRAALVIGFAYLGDFTYLQVTGVRENLEERTATDPAAATPLYGVWTVEQFELDGLPVVGNEPEIWLRVVVGNPWRLALATRGVPFARYFTQLDPLTKASLSLSKSGETNSKSVLRVEREGDDGLSLTGTFEGREIWAQLKRLPTPDYQLMTRAFRWVNEFPYNR